MATEAIPAPDTASADPGTVASVGDQSGCCCCKCCCSAGTVPFYRAYNGRDHFYTTDLAERDNAISKLNYRSEGIACYVWPSQQCGGVPFYRLFQPKTTGDHFYTTSASERDNAIKNLGYVSEGTACYVLTSQSCRSSIPLYRLFNSGTGDHFYTTSAAERDSAIKGGYTSEGTACFVFPIPT